MTSAGKRMEAAVVGRRLSRRLFNASSFVLDPLPAGGLARGDEADGFVLHFDGDRAVRRVRNGDPRPSTSQAEAPGAGAPGALSAGTP